ncbi:predicted protein [Uncinocarpus reesii 1704]|uniref:Protein kinase domain-containing protein n=1 Tax=Uncinocarpus reesii (strain UAMH 1704) TaxID=336963 RepID=C4JVN7_UNCRE|nr:uncharacterized protein UREG_06629 [Uncinocarpus reesii 1704]EEP81764.1 predicted protein [Uncinocarpus reesii 1704]
MSTNSRGSPNNAVLEETQNPDYDPKKFYPARVGETINNQYRLISKLGFGTGSTVWLAKDVTRWRWQSDRYMAIKITNSKAEDRTSAQKEIRMFERLSQIRTKHEGKEFVRRLEESFEIQDLKADNFLLGFEDPAVLEEYVRRQESDPALCTEIDGRPVYESSLDFGPLKRGVGKLRMSDFGAAVSGDVPTPYNHDIQPQEFCAPEVLLKATWTYSADIWNLGMMLWELLQDSPPLNGIGPGCNTYSLEAHFGQLIRLLGPPPTRTIG